MLITHLSESVRYTGRWAKMEKAAVTTAPGAFFELAFKGDVCDLMFDVDLNSEPFPRIYIQLDGGARVESAVLRYIRIEAPNAGNHVLTVYFKGAREEQQRWYEPLVGKISFIGANASEEGVLPEDNREIIEFIGDSITEGIWVDDGRYHFEPIHNRFNMVFQNDATATYAYLTAKKLGMKPHIMGYGSVGVTKSGGGGVPKAADAYPYVFNKVPAEPSGAKIIVINHGANDQGAESALYLKEYSDFLDVVRRINPCATIIALSAFCGVCNDELGKMISEYNKMRGDNVVYISTAGWIPREPLHPLREGHSQIADFLASEISEKILFN